jgi:hypothetical protein
MIDFGGNENTSRWWKYSIYTTENGGFNVRFQLRYIPIPLGWLWKHTLDDAINAVHIHINWDDEPRFKPKKVWRLP